ncbi:MAG TPA: hypothetical protein VKB58_01770 [Terriglobales bacterium]|jgi:hypothetical protein|nr:hypothetical protein [Terriglobales bacterium]
MFGLVVLVITLAAAVFATVASLKFQYELRNWKFLTGGIAFGLLLGAIFYWEQMHVAKQALRDRDQAVAEAYKVEDVGRKYEEQARTLTDQVVGLEAQVSAQAKKLNELQGTSEAVGDSSQQQTSGLPSIYWVQDNDTGENGRTAQVRFRIYGPLNLPAFVAICEHPCKTLGGQAGNGSAGVPLSGSSQKNVAGFIFSKPKPMAGGTTGTVTVQSTDKEPVSVKDFRILRESEVPENLK